MRTVLLAFAIASIIAAAVVMLIPNRPKVADAVVIVFIFDAAMFISCAKLFTS